MKLKKEFITHNTDSESLLVPTGAAGFSGLVKGNKTLGVILDLLKDDTTEADIIPPVRLSANPTVTFLSLQISTSSFAFPLISSFISVISTVSRLHLKPLGLCDKDLSGLASFIRSDDLPLLKLIYESCGLRIA